MDICPLCEGEGENLDMAKCLECHGFGVVGEVEIEDVEEFVCEECRSELSKDDEYHVKWGTCNSYCYGKMVGVYA